MPELADEALLAAVDVARAALLEITPADTIGEPVGHIIEGEHVVSLLFDCTMAGYPGWHWTVSLSRIDGGSEPSVLETELMPGGGALLAPEWVPWSDRLADYRTAQELAAAEAEANTVEPLDDDALDEATDEEDDEFDDDDDELDGIDFDEAIASAKLAATEVNPGEAAESQGEPDERAPEPPAEAGVDELGPERDDDDEDH